MPHAFVVFRDCSSLEPDFDRCFTFGDDADLNVSLDPERDTSAFRFLTGEIDRSSRCCFSLSPLSLLRRSLLWRRPLLSFRSGLRRSGDLEYRSLGWYFFYRTGERRPLDLDERRELLDLLLDTDE